MCQTSVANAFLDGRQVGHSQSQIHLNLKVDALRMLTRGCLEKRQNVHLRLNDEYVLDLRVPLAISWEVNMFEVSQFRYKTIVAVVI